MPKIFRIFLFSLLFIFWLVLIVKFEHVRIFTCIIPPALVFNFSKVKRIRNAAISLFVVIWLFIFHFESTRYFYYKEPIAKKIEEVVPKFKFLFPPIGWIMFYNIDDSFGHVIVYGKKGDETQPLDPHEIFRTRTIGYDNIHRGILGTASYKQNVHRFCRFLYHRFEYFDTFIVSMAHYPQRSVEPYKRIQNVLYTCPDRLTYGP